MPTYRHVPALKTDPQEVLEFLQRIVPEKRIHDRMLDAITSKYAWPNTLAGYFNHDQLHDTAAQIARAQDTRKSSARGGEGRASEKGVTRWIDFLSQSTSLTTGFLAIPGRGPKDVYAFVSSGAEGAHGATQ
jgi:hypothetical protein